MAETIVYIGGFEFPDKNAAAHRVLNNAKILRQLGYNVVFIGTDKSPEKNFDILTTKSYVQGFEAYSVPYPKSNKSWFAYLTNIKPYVEIIDSYSDVCMIIMYNFQAIAMNRLMNYCRKKEIKCCADITEWRSSKGERTFIYRILKESDTRFRMKVLNKKLDALIVISTYLQNYYKDCKNVVLIPPLVDVSEEKWINHYEKPKDVLKLCYAGSLKDRLDVLVYALRKVKRPCKLDIVGITKEEFLKLYPEFEDISDKNIIFHGRISHLEVLKYIKQANYSCFFRDNNRVSNAGFPTKLVEALTCGTPVFTNRTSDIEKYMNNSNGILIDGIEIDVIRESIEKAPVKKPENTKVFDYHLYFSEMKHILNFGDNF